MVSMLIIFFVEFASSRYLARIDEKVMAIQLRESGCQDRVGPLTTFLTRRKVVINGRQVGIGTALAGKAVERVTATVIHESTPLTDEESPLLGNSNGDGVARQKPSSRRNSHTGHHHYDPPPVDGSDCPAVSDATRKSQLLAVAIMEGGLCFHSLFVGLTLAISTGSGFVSLLTAIMFHRRSLFANVVND